VGEMEGTIQEKIKQLKQNDNQIQQLKAKLRDAEERNSKYENYYIPRIKETRKFHNEIYDELEKIRQDAELLPSMFRAEA
jgi:cell shape-determining protein MreC